MQDISLTEEMVLWAVWRLQDNAYGVTIRRHVTQATQHIFPYGTLYGTLAKLVRQGYLMKTVSDPKPARGGRSKNYYHITKTGVEALRAALKLRKSLWNEKTESALGKS
ncbi:MAG: PadR family transcriptional regulator [Candidatus Aminicenantes bacterium]|nr:PadR family transcriptional regulator [Candidatus Aminicenantes bacterium]